MPNLKQNTDGSMGVEGAQKGNGGFIVVSCEYGTSAADKVFFVAPRDYRVASIYARPTAADSQAGTIILRKVASGTALSSGTALFDTSSPITTNGTANTVQTKTVTTTGDVNKIPQGTAIGMDITTSTTSGTGVITLVLNPA